MNTQNDLLLQAIPFVQEDDALEERGRMIAEGLIRDGFKTVAVARHFAFEVVNPYQDGGDIVLTHSKALTVTSSQKPTKKELAEAARLFFSGDAAFDVTPKTQEGWTVTSLSLGADQNGNKPWALYRLLALTEIAANAKKAEVAAV
jgi:hypothetical protein